MALTAGFFKSTRMDKKCNGREIPDNQECPESNFSKAAKVAAISGGVAAAAFGANALMKRRRPGMSGPKLLPPSPKAGTLGSGGPKPPKPGSPFGRRRGPKAPKPPKPRSPRRTKMATAAPKVQSVFSMNKVSHRTGGPRGRFRF